MEPHTLHANVVQAQFPLFLDAQHGAPLVPKYQDLGTGIFVIAGMIQDKYVFAAKIAETSCVWLDTGVQIEYSSYRRHGLNSLRAHGYPDISRIHVFVNPTQKHLASVYAHLLETPKPSQLCTVRVKVQGRNSYVPEYHQWIGKDNHDAR